MAGPVSTGAALITLQTDTVLSADVASNLESGTQITSRKLAGQTSPSSATLSSASSKPINSFTAPSTLKLAVSSSAASHPKVDGESNDGSSEAQQGQEGSFSF